MKTLTKLEALLAAATPGEWDYTIQSNGLSSVYGNCQRDSMADADLIAFDLRNEHDAELIALMKNHLPALIECVKALYQISLCSQNSASSKEECGGIARKALLPFRASGYSLAQIAFELERTALGDGYYGNALRVAKDIHGVSDKDRSLLDRFATGTNGGTDHVALQDLALRIDALAKLQESKS